MERFVLTRGVSMIFIREANFFFQSWPFFKGGRGCGEVCTHQGLIYDFHKRGKLSFFKCENMCILLFISRAKDPIDIICV